MRSRAEGSGVDSLFGKTRVPSPSPARRAFNARSNHEWQGALIMDDHPGMPYPERFECFLSLSADGVAVVRFDARFEFKVNPAALACFNAYPHIRANGRTAVSRFAHILFLCVFKSRIHEFCMAANPIVVAQATHSYHRVFAW